MTINTRSFAPWLPEFKRTKIAVSQSGEFFNGTIIRGEPQISHSADDAFRMTPPEAAYFTSLVSTTIGERWSVREVEEHEATNVAGPSEDFVLAGFNFAATAALMLDGVPIPRPEKHFGDHLIIELIRGTAEFDDDGHMIEDDIEQHIVHFPAQGHETGMLGRQLGHIIHHFVQAGWHVTALPSLDKLPSNG